MFSREEKYIVFLLQSCRPPSIFHNAYGFSVWVTVIPLSLNPLEQFPNGVAVCCFSKLTTNLKLLYLVLWVHLGFSSKWKMWHNVALQFTEQINAFIEQENQLTNKQPRF